MCGFFYAHHYCVLDSISPVSELLSNLTYHVASLLSCSKVGGTPLKAGYLTCWIRKRPSSNGRWWWGHGSGNMFWKTDRLECYALTSTFGTALTSFSGVQKFQESETTSTCSPHWLYILEWQGKDSGTSGALFYYLLLATGRAKTDKHTPAWTESGTYWCHDLSVAFDDQQVWHFGLGQCPHPSCHWSWQRSFTKARLRLVWCHGSRFCAKDLKRTNMCQIEKRDDEIIWKTW